MQWFFRRIPAVVLLLLVITVSCGEDAVQPPVCAVSPTSIDFGTVTVPTPTPSLGAGIDLETVAVGSSKDTTFTIRNAGKGAVRGDVSLTCTEHYSILSGAGSYNLGEGQSHQVTIRFEPTVTGTQGCVVELGSDICGDVSLSGEGELEPAACVVQPTSIDLDTVTIGTFRDTAITITNTGGATLNGDVSLTCAQHYTILAGGGAFGVGAGQSHQVTVRFEPTTTETHVCSVDFGVALCNDVDITGVGDREDLPIAFGEFDGSSSGSGGFSLVTGLAADAVGDVYVADSFANRIQKFNSFGTFLGQVGSFGVDKEMFSNPRGIALGPNDATVWVAEWGNDRIQKLSAQFSWLAFVDGTGGSAGALAEPVDVDSDQQGNIYVVDQGNLRIQKFDSDGNFITVWGTAGTGDGQFTIPQGIAVDQSGYVYVVEGNTATSGVARIQKFDGDGNFIMKWGSTGAAEGQFNNPMGIDVDENGRIYVADSNNGRIQKFTSDGVLVAVWDVPVGPIDVTAGGSFVFVVKGVLNQTVQVYWYGP